MSNDSYFPSQLIQALYAGAMVQNRVRTFGGFTLDIELVAIDGLVGAARLGGAEKGPVSALAQALAELPPRIKTDMKEMEGICGSYAKALAQCAYAALRFGSLKKAYLIAEASCAKSDLTKANLAKLRAKLTTSVDDFEEHMFHARGALRRVRGKLRDFESIVRSSQYVGNYMSIEAASLEDGAGSFSNLAAEIHKQSQRLADVLELLFSDADRSELTMTSRRAGLAA